MKDYFGNEIDIKAVGTPARYGWPMQVNGIELILPQRETGGGTWDNVYSLDLLIEKISIKVNHPTGSFTIGLSSLPLVLAKEEQAKQGNESTDQSIPSVPRVCVDCGNPLDERFHNGITGNCLGDYEG